MSCRGGRREEDGGKTCSWKKSKDDENGKGSYIWYSEEGTGWGCSPPRPLLAVPNVTAHPSTPNFVLFNVAL